MFLIIILLKKSVTVFTSCLVVRGFSAGAGLQRGARFSSFGDFWTVS